MVKFKHDPEAKALYVYVAKGKIAKTEMVSPNLFVDQDRRGNIVGFEILGVKKKSKKLEVLIDFPDSARELKSLASAA